MNARLLAAVMAVIAVLLLFNALRGAIDPAGQPETLSYTAFKQLVRDGAVSEVTMRGDALTARLGAVEGEAGRAVASRLPPTGDPQLLDLLESHGAEVTARPPAEGGWWVALLPWLLLIGLYAFFWLRISRRMPGAGGQMDRFLKGRAGQEEKAARRFTFADVAGQENAKAEVAELVDFLRDPEPYRAIGAEAPRGILLMGPPGTGKTLLARALAGESGVPFFNISASEFIEMYVGVGASRVRAMYDEAKKRAPSILFIDELDAVGRVRGAGVGGGHDEREQTLNQILSEMDGFAGHEAVIVLAATSRPDVLDPALLRPGRFDRHVTLDLPDRRARLAILQVHVRGKPLAEDVDLAAIAGGTPGFSGADLKNIVNEAAIACAREGAARIAMTHFDTARDRVMLGMERHLAIGPEERHRLAVHEAGHTTLAFFLPHADPVYKVTIIPRGQALGRTHLLPEEEHYTQPEPVLRDRLAVLLAGRAAEAALIGNVSSGADDDIRQATRLARAMVGRWGMSDRLGPMDLRQSDEHPFLGREIAQPRSFSDATAHAVDREVARLLREAEARAGAVIAERREPMRRLVASLEREETLDGAAVAGLLRPASGDGGAQGEGEDAAAQPSRADVSRQALPRPAAFWREGD